MEKRAIKTKKPKTVPPPKERVKPARGPDLTLKKKNYILLGVGIATIGVGFITLHLGSITLAPLLLVIGYCVLIPLALLLK